MLLDCGLGMSQQWTNSNLLNELLLVILKTVLNKHVLIQLKTYFNRLIATKK